MHVRSTKIVVIGAGSASFGQEVLSDLFTAREALRGSTIVLVDVNGSNLEKVAALARLANRVWDAGYTIEASTDRRVALPGAEFVIVAVASRREEMWRHDFAVPIRHGVRHVLGENGGPGALFHAARSISLVLPIARDMEALCPGALLINFTNPMGRVCRAVTRYTSIRAVGLCHQVGHAFMTAGRVFGDIPVAEKSWDEHKAQLGMMEGTFHVVAAGINHFTWLLGLSRLGDGRDLLPRFRERVHAMPPDFEPLSRFLFDTYGLMPTGGDLHVGEYVACAHEMVGMRGYDFEEAERERAQMWEKVERIGSGREKLPPQPAPSWERAVPVIVAMCGGPVEHLPSLNLPNKGLIPNLPPESVVETPATVDLAGPHGQGVGPLPTGVAALCRRQLEIQELAVEAAVTGDRRLALQALLLDPLVPGAASARAILDELLRLEADELPMFA